jgi:hypothetical protein
MGKGYVPPSAPGAVKKILDELQEKALREVLPKLPSPPAFLVFDEEVLMTDAQWENIFCELGGAKAAVTAAVYTNKVPWKQIIPMPSLSMEQWQEIARTWERRQEDMMARAFLKAHEFAEQAGLTAMLWGPQCCTTADAGKAGIVSAADVQKAVEDFTKKFAPENLTSGPILSKELLDAITQDCWEMTQQCPWPPAEWFAPSFMAYYHDYGPVLSTKSIPNWLLFDVGSMAHADYEPRRRTWYEKLMYPETQAWLAWGN